MCGEPLGKEPIALCCMTPPHRLLHLPLLFLHLVALLTEYRSAIDTRSGASVAIKCMMNVFSDSKEARRALREIKLLKHFSGSQNVCILLHVVLQSFPLHY